MKSEDIHAIIDKKITIANDIYQRTIALGNITKVVLQYFNSEDIEEIDDCFSETEDDETCLFISIIFKNKKMLTLLFLYFSPTIPNIRLDWEVYHLNEYYEEQKISSGHLLTDNHGYFGNMYEDDIVKIKECLKTPTVDLYE